MDWGGLGWDGIGGLVEYCTVGWYGMVVSGVGEFFFIFYAGGKKERKKLLCLSIRAERVLLLFLFF